LPVPLSALVRRSYVLCQEEDVSQLLDALTRENLKPAALHPSYSPKELCYARNTRAFIGHAAVWRRVIDEEGYTLVCEADFVPCIGIGSFPVFWPIGDPLSWGYLYQGSPRLLSIVDSENTRFLRGHCAPLVGYVLNAAVARLFLDYFSAEIACRDPYRYFTFDAHLQWWVMGRGARAFIPLRHYGEHGGLPNPEHAANRIGRSGRHRADNLAGSLHFLPQYAKGRRMRFLAVRLASRALGFARLLTNRWIVKTNVYQNGVRQKLQMLAIGFYRLM
jgi:hypothetical protein